MISAGIPIHHALGLLAESSDSEDDQRTLSNITLGVAGGRTLSICLNDHPEAFSDYIVGLVRVGEKTGALAHILETIADHTEKSEALRLKLRSAVTYPAFLILGALTLMLLGPSYLLEGQLVMLRQSGQELPFLTRLMIGWTDFVTSPLFLLVAALLVALLSSAVATPEKRKAWVLRLHQVPILEEFLKLVATARFSRSLEIALKSGVPALQALPLAATATADPLLQSRMETVKRELIAGDTMSGSLSSISFFAPGFTELVHSGEEAGKVPVMLALIAQFAELELELAVRRATTLIEPTILLGMGIFTAIVLVATLQPTISLLQTL